MANYVGSGAKTKCSMGDSSATLEVLPDRRVQLDGQNLANIMDNKPMVNIKPFGQCQSMANPTVAAATAANYGKLQPMPCVPNIPGPWTPGETGVMVKNQPALLDNCKLMCAWAGIIELTDDGQTGANDAANVDSRGHEFDAKEFGGLYGIDFSF